MSRLLLALLVGAAALVGCAAPTAGAAAPSQLQAEPDLGVEVPAPSYLAVPAIGAESTLEAVGLVDGAIDVAPATEPMQAAWWDGSPRPGAVGPAVILGHVDGEINGRRGQPGIFHRLRELAPGDAIVIDRADGSQVQFVVYATEKVPKAEFPADRVYGNVDRAELRLITCGGAFDRKARSYEDNIVVYAALAS